MADQLTFSDVYTESLRKELEEWKEFSRIQAERRSAERTREMFSNFVTQMLILKMTKK